MLGLDMGASSMKLVQVRLSHERAVLETYGELATGPYGSKGVGQGVRLSGRKAQEAIVDLVRETGATAKEAVAAIPLHHSFVTMVELPRMQQKDLESAIRYEARRYVPIPLTEVEVDWWHIPEEATNEENTIATPTKETVQVLLVAVSKEILAKYKAIVTDAGLSLHALEIETFGAIRSVMGRERSGVLFVDFGAVTTKMTILEQGVVRASHSIDKGAQDITLTLAESLGIEFERAEIMKREVGMTPRAEHQETIKVVTPLVDYVFIELERFVVDYTERYKRAVAKIYIVGGGALLPGLRDAMVKKFGVEVLVGTPFARVQYPAFFEPVLREIGPSFSVAVGLALRGLT